MYLDDIVVSGSTVEEHTTRLTMVLERSSAANLRLRREKCQFGVLEVRFLGHKVDAEGIHTTQDKVRAMVEAPPPTSKRSLQAFLGLLSFYDRFLELRATVATALYQLLQKDVAWACEDRHQEAFESLKRLLLQRTVLVHYDLARSLIISCDASPYGVGAVLAQEDRWGSEVPIAFA